VDENQRTMLAYNIMAIPTLLLFKDGKVVEQIVGFQGKDALLRKVQAHLGQPAV